MLELKPSTAKQIVFTRNFFLNDKDFPKGPGVKTPPAHEEDMGLIPGPGTAHVLRGN